MRGHSFRPITGNCALLSVTSSVLRSSTLEEPCAPSRWLVGPSLADTTMD